MTISGLQPNNLLQQLPTSIRTALDGNSNGTIETTEVVDFLEQLLSAVKDSPGTAYDSKTGHAVISKSTPVPMPGATTSKEEVRESDPTASTTGTWRDFVYGNSTSGTYAGVMVAPGREIGAGYKPGP